MKTIRERIIEDLNLLDDNTLWMLYNFICGVLGRKADYED